jgi:hypothetical protein
MSMRALNLMALKQIRFMGLTDRSIGSKDWAIRIMVNVVDMGDRQESAIQLLNLLFNPDVMVSKTEVAKLIKAILNED